MQTYTTADNNPRALPSYRDGATIDKIEDASLAMLSLVKSKVTLTKSKAEWRKQNMQGTE